MENKEQKLAYKGELNLGGAIIPCYVTDDGMRVLSGRTITGLIGMKGRGPGITRILSLGTIRPYLDVALQHAIENPLQISGFGVRTYGYEATVLLHICEAFLQARDKDVLKSDQEIRYAQYADMLIRSFAKVGIIALIDEATGYQEVRARDALQAILDKFLRKEFAAWAKRFPNEFYKELFRLKGWPYDPSSVRRPAIIGKFTNDLVYDRLAPGILAELQAKNPITENGYRKVRHHQFLTDEIGHPALSQHLYAVITLMKASNTWDSFYRAMQKALPKKDETGLQLAMWDE